MPKIVYIWLNCVQKKIIVTQHHKKYKYEVE